MKLFQQRRRFLFRIEKSRPGEYANSPRVWSSCGYIRAANRADATVAACFHVGSSMVRVILEGQI